VVRYDDERVWLLVRLVVISEYDTIVRVEVTSDVGKGETAHLDETGESLEVQQFSRP
jgi:hypothetical protein